MSCFCGNIGNIGVRGHEKVINLLLPLEQSGLSMVYYRCITFYENLLQWF